MGILKKKKARPVLVFGDCHAPYHHRLAIDFLKRIQRDYDCRDEVVCTGDLFDFHAMSAHTPETDADSPLAEYKKALEFSRRLGEAFPKGVLVLGNHDLIPQRQMKELGLIEQLLKNPNEMYGLPKGWKVEPLKHIISPWDILVQHGVNTSGVGGALSKATIEGCSFIMGHAHSEAGVHFLANHREVKFGLNTGCLCDNTAIAMRYAKYAKKKGVLGCGVVYSSGYAIFVPMEFRGSK